MKHIRLFIATCAIVLGLGGMVPAVALAAAPSAQSVVCKTLQSNSGCTSTPSGSVSIDHLVSAIITIFSFVIGVVAVIMIMVGGFRYITAGGDSNSVSSAKNTIIYAIVGLVIAAFAQAIVRFVLNKTT